MNRPVVGAVIGMAVLSGCESLPPPPPAAPPISVATLYQQPGERSLILGLSLYEQAVFDRAEDAFRNALKIGLRDRRDEATAHKFLAFIDCAFNRLAECEAQFRAALASDPAFRLTDAEIGHPIWGPVYKGITAKAVKPSASEKK